MNQVQTQPQEPTSIVQAENNPANNSAGGVDLEFAGVNHLMMALSSMPVENAVAAPVSEQRSNADLEKLAKQTEDRLASLAQTNLNLVHSASVVFQELRYYDAVRLRMYAQNTFGSLVKMIGESTGVPVEVKQHIPEFNYLAFPMMIDPNEITTEVVVSIYHKEPVIEVVFDLIFKSGRVSSTSNRFKYR